MARSVPPESWEDLGSLVSDSQLLLGSQGPQGVTEKDESPTHTPGRCSSPLRSWSRLGCSRHGVSRKESSQWKAAQLHPALGSMLPSPSREHCHLPNLETRPSSWSAHKATLSSLLYPLDYLRAATSSPLPTMCMV